MISKLMKICHNKRQLLKHRCCILLASIGLLLQIGKCIPIYAFSEIIDEELELIVPEQEHQQNDHTGKEQYKYETNDILSGTSQSNNLSGNQSNKPSNNTQSDKGTAGTSQSSNNQSGNQSSKPSSNTQSDKGTAGTSQSSNNQSNILSSNQSNKPSGNTQLNNVHQEKIQANNKNGSFCIDISLKNGIEAESHNPISEEFFERIHLNSQEQSYNKLQQKQLLQEKLTALDDTLNGIMTKNDALSISENVCSELYGKNNYDIMSWSREFFSIAASVFFVLMFLISVIFLLIRKGREF